MVTELRERLAWQAYRLSITARDRGILGERGGRWIARLHAIWSETYLRRCEATDRRRPAAPASYPPSFARS
ncbi:MAG: hypothetical protein CMM50_00150 [Rhodospirillaceae bacterium]|nr:hypothetical protein [Rhodospirillaceae bacterium]